MIRPAYFLYGFIVLFIFFLFAGAIISPTKFNSDPGLGFLDLINFQKGGKFQYHSEPAIDNLRNCVQTRTTWWSPGQWFFIYLVNLTGLSLGKSISVIVLIATVLGLVGWMRIYRWFGFTEKEVWLSGVLILVSRYLFSAFQIYPGASLLEFAAAPWVLICWLHTEQKNIWIQLIVLFPIIIVAYFIKSSMLIFILGMVASVASIFRLRSVPWWTLTSLFIVFLLGKYCCDWLFVKGGYTPFSYPGHLISLNRGNILEQIQSLLFILSGPFLSSIGFDDYIHFFLQKPGHIIFTNGHPVMLFIYCTSFIVFFFLLQKIISHRKEYSEKYIDLLLPICSIFIVFFLYAFLFSKSISGNEESRHFRLAGLLLLPLMASSLIKMFRYLFWIIPGVLFIYACFSYVNKLKEHKVISVQYQVPYNEMSSDAEYRVFREAAEKADITYVIYAEQKYELEHCKTIYNQDDFVPLDVIRSRPKIKVKDMQLVFLLPHRFATNGKREAILANFTEDNNNRKAERRIRELPNWELITINY